VMFDRTVAWQKLVLRLGIAKLIDNNKVVALSCNVMRRLFLETLAPKAMPQVHHIFSFCKSPGNLDLLELTKYLFEHLNVISLSRKESWVKDRVSTKKKGPSEKTYQGQFYTTLFGICTHPWSLIFEMKGGGGGKVDLGLIYKDPETETGMKKFMIELGVNLARKGDKGHSCKGHYDRQVETYNTNPVDQSIVIMIDTNKHRKGFYWPGDIHPHVQYIVVEHFLDKDPNELKLYLSTNKNNPILMTIQGNKGTTKRKRTSEDEDAEDEDDDKPKKKKQKLKAPRKRGSNEGSEDEEDEPKKKRKTKSKTKKQTPQKRSSSDEDSEDDV